LGRLGEVHDAEDRHVRPLGERRHQSAYVGIAMRVCRAYIRRDRIDDEEAGVRLADRALDRRGIRELDSALALACAQASEMTDASVEIPR
jgi:hypothetical protein